MEHYGQSLCKVCGIVQNNFRRGKKKRCMDWLAVSAWHLALSCLGQPQPVCFGLPVHTFSCVFRYEPRTCWCLSLIHNFLQVVLD